MSKFVICYIFLPFSSVEAEMAQVQAHEKVTSRCLFKAFDNALESQCAIFSRMKSKSTKKSKIISEKITVLYLFVILPLKAKMAHV